MEVYMGIRRMNTKKKKSFRAEIKVRGERYSKKFKTEQGATAWINGHQVLKMAHPGSNQHQRIMTLGQALVITLESAHRRGLEEHSIQTFEWQLRHFNKILNVNIMDLSPKQLTDSFKSIRKIQGGEIPSKSYLQGILNRLIQTLDIAARKGFYMKEFEEAEGEILNYIKNYGKNPRETNLYTEAELGQLLEDRLLDPTEAYWVLPFIKILAMTGKRCGEVIALTDQDIDYERNRIRIWKMVTNRQYHNHLKCQGKPHYVEMDEELIKVIKTVQAENKARGNACEWLFPAPDDLFSKRSVKEKCPFAGRPVTQPAVHKASFNSLS